MRASPDLPLWTSMITTLYRLYAGSFVMGARTLHGKSMLVCANLRPALCSLHPGTVLSMPVRREEWKHPSTSGFPAYIQQLCLSCLVIYCVRALAGKLALVRGR